PAVDRTDVDDRLRTAIAVRRVVLPRRDPLEHGAGHLVEAEDRVLVALALTERGVDEVAVHADPEPERAEVTEDDLAFGRLAEQAHVGDAAVRDEVRRASGVAAELGPLGLAVLRLLDLAADGGDKDVSAQPHVRLLQSANGFDVAREGAFHVRDA